MKTKWMFLFSFMIMGLFCISSVQGAELGETLYVSCHNLPVHELPSAFSEVLEILEYSEPVVISKISKDSEGFADKGEYAKWLKVEIPNREAGYVSEECLIEKGLMQRQNAGLKSKAYNTSSASSGGKSFSEAEDDIDHFAMKGWGGKAKKSDKVDYTTLKSVLISRSQGNAQKETVGFRMEGGLAEFQKEGFGGGNEIKDKGLYAKKDNEINPYEDGSSSNYTASPLPENTYSRIETDSRKYEKAKTDFQSTQAFRISKNNDFTNSPVNEHLPVNQLYNLIKHFRKSNPRRSIELCNKAIQINPKFPQVYNERGYAYTYLGNYSQACSDFLSAEKLGDDFGIKWSRSWGYCR